MEALTCHLDLVGLLSTNLSPVTITWLLVVSVAPD
jgi:hypothetical protein